MIVDWIEVLASLRDVLGAQDPADVETATLAAARSLFLGDAAIWLDLVGEDLHLIALAGLAQPDSHFSVVVPAGSGLGGSVIESDKPVVIDDFWTNPRSNPSLNRLMQREGIVSLAGVPMHSPSEVVGVLWLLSRRPRRFRDEELNLLASIASFAAALRARLKERDAARLEAAAERRRADEVERFQRASDVLAIALLQGRELGAALERASDELEVRLHVEGLPAVQPLTESLAAPSAGGWQSHASAQIPGTDFSILADQPSFPNAQLESVARLIGLEIHRQRAQAKTELELTDSLVHDLLAGDPAALDRLHHRASLIGMSLDIPRTPVSVGLDVPVSRHLLEQLDRQMQARTNGGQATVFDGDVVLLWPVASAEDQRRIHQHVSELVASLQRVELVAGIGPVCREAGDYSPALREALFARKIASRTTGGKRVIASSELGMYRMFAHVGGMSALQAAVRETLGPLLTADARDGSRLVETTRAFLERDRRIAETSRALHVHTNTLRYRLERITNLLAIDLDDPEARFATLLALRLLDVVGLPDHGAAMPTE